MRQILILLPNLAFLPVILSQISQHVQPNQPCNPDSDLLLMENRALSPAAYLRCVAIGIGGLGYWTQNFCPAGMVFEFLSQQCKYPAAPTNEIQSNSVRKELELMNIAILNGSCIHGEQCIGGTVCDPIQGRCLCPYGTVANLETLSCTATPALGSVQMPKQSAPGESCANGEKCSGGSICVTSLWKCLCPQELENVNGQCVQPTYAARVPLHGQCSVSAQCPDGSSCVNNQCLCISPYVELQGACVEAQKPAQKTAGPGELCNHGEVCQRGSVCDSKIPVCVCPPGTDLENGECVQVRTTLAALNTFYTKPTKTWVDPQKSYGKYGPQPPQPYPQAPQPPTVLNTRPQSQVIFPSQPAPPLYTAVPPQPTPQTAPPTQARTVPSFPTQPLTAPARSVTSRPQNPFRIMSTQKVEVGKPCTLNADCTADAYCNGNTTPPTCQCLSTHVEINSKCEKIMYPGQTGCNADKQCQAAFPGTSCQNGQCVCPQGLVAKEQTCVVEKTTEIPPGGSCAAGEKCVGGSVCHRGWCVCPDPLMVIYGGECRKPTYQQVSAYGRPSSPAAPPPTQATQPPTRPPQQQETVAQQVYGTLSGNRVNSAPLNSMKSANGGNLLQPRTIAPGKQCGPLDQCAGGSVCVSGYCLCPSGMAPDANGICKPRGNVAQKPVLAEVQHQKLVYARPTESCASGEICTGGAICQQRTKCVCPDNKPIIRNFICIEHPNPTAVPKWACEGDVKCPENSTCDGGDCKCQDGYVKQGDKCVMLPREKNGEKVGLPPAHKYAKPGRLCNQGQLCTGGSICDSSSKVCWCAKRHTIVNGTCTNNTMSSVLGENCDDKKSCQSGAVCVDGVCKCPEGYIEEEGFCTKLVQRKRFKSYRYYEPTLGAARCQPELCRPPDCFCSLTGRTPPINVPKDQLPQIVVLTFDDPVNDKSMRDYVEIFQFINFTSPSGCSVKGTFFVSHEWTNYNQVEQLADHGHELASNSITHRLLTFANYSDWLIEMDGQRKMLARYANVDESQIIGMRAPQLGLGGDLQYKMAQQSGFIYDNSISVDSGINWEPFWPQTLDYSLPFACESDHCPRSSIPGLWMIPMNVYYGHTLKSPMLQGILAGDEDDAEILRLLDMNFQRYYTRNKAPFVINLSNDFLQRDGGVGMRALKSFLLQLHQLPDVHFMTLRELVDWMRAPLTHQQLLTKRQCGLYSYTPPIVPRTCLSPNKCMYNTPYLGQSEHIFYTCNRCPLTYPWI